MSHLFITPVLGLIFLSLSLGNSYKKMDVTIAAPQSSYNITVNLPSCQDIWCLDQCDTCHVVIYTNTTPPVPLRSQLYNGSCRYYFTVSENDICAQIVCKPACGVACNPDCHDLLVYGLDYYLYPWCP